MYTDNNWNVQISTFSILVPSSMDSRPMTTQGIALMPSVNNWGVNMGKVLSYKTQIRK